MSRTASVPTEGGVFHGTPLRSSEALLWANPSTDSADFTAAPARPRFPPALRATASLAAPSSLHETGLPRLKPPSATLLRDVSGDVARVAAAERALRRLQHENDQLKSSELANQREQAEMRHIIATLQDELRAMETLVSEQVATLKAVSTEMVRLDPYHMVKRRRRTSDAATPPPPPPAVSEVTDAHEASLDALTKRVDSLVQEQQDATQERTVLRADKTRLEEEVARWAAAAAVTDSEHAACVATQEELQKNFAALEAFACQWCACQRSPTASVTGSSTGVPACPLTTGAALFHVELRFLACVDAAVLVDEWRDRAPRTDDDDADKASVALSSICLVATDPLQRRLLTATASRTASTDSVDFDVLDAADAPNTPGTSLRGEFTCAAGVRWPITVEVHAACTGAESMVRVAAATVPLSALTATRKHHRLGGPAALAPHAVSRPQTLCLPLQLVPSDAGRAARAGAPAIERECGTLCLEVTVTPFDALWGRHAITTAEAAAPSPPPAASVPSLPPLPDSVDEVVNAAPSSPAPPAPPAPPVLSEEALPAEATAEPVLVPPAVAVPPPSALPAAPAPVEAPCTAAPAAALPPLPPPVPVPQRAACTPTDPVVAASAPSSANVSVNASVDASVTASPPAGTETLVVEVRSASELLECAGSDGDVAAPCDPRVQVWVGEELVFTTPLVHQGRSPAWTVEEGRVLVSAPPTTPLRFDVQDVQGLEVDFIGSAFLWLSDALAARPCVRTLPVLLSGKRHGALTVSFGSPS